MFLLIRLTIAITHGTKLASSFIGIGDGGPESCTPLAAQVEMGECKVLVSNPTGVKLRLDEFLFARMCRVESMILQEMFTIDRDDLAFAIVTH